MKFALLARLFVYALVLAVAMWAAWLIKAKNGQDRKDQEARTALASCIRHQRLTQQAMRALQSTQKLNVGDPIPWDKIYGEKGLLSGTPSCPATGPDAYTRATTIPEPGILILTCRNPAHRPKETAGW